MTVLSTLRATRSHSNTKIFCKIATYNLASMANECSCFVARDVVWGGGIADLGLEDAILK